jgi:hypothetical protein
MDGNGKIGAGTMSEERNALQSVLKVIGHVLILSLTSLSLQADTVLGQPDTKGPESGEQINWQVIAGGGQTDAASDNYRMGGTIGQLASGFGSSTSHNLYHGFWQIESTAEGCCIGRVGDANGIGGDEPTIGDISVMIDALFISGTCEGVIPCVAEADINQSGGANPICDDITIGDISILIDYLFITGSSLGLPDYL